MTVLAHVLWGTEDRLWNFVLEKPLSVHSLLSCCEDLDAVAENSVKEEVLACEVSESLKDSFGQFGILS